ncbi:MAG: hypothetical protein HY656_02820 [Acidobacteria bacterium]|nr:hypothetical protein [Acidobacteriota bacterium]
MRGGAKLALLVIGGVIVLGVVALFVWVLSGPESGVKMANEMDQYALDYLAKHHILNPDEKLICYYDVTLSMDASEAAILTDRRLLYHKAGRTTAMSLSDIADIEHHYESLIGDVIVARSAAGETMKIEIAPLNGGEVFYTTLMNSWKLAGGRNQSSP